MEMLPCCCPIWILSMIAAIGLVRAFLRHRREKRAAKNGSLQPPQNP